MTEQQIEKRIEQAPKVFQESLRRLHSMGLFTDPKAIARLEAAAERVKNEMQEDWDKGRD